MYEMKTSTPANDTSAGAANPDQETPRETARTNPKPKSEVVTKVRPEPLLVFRPQTGEFICIPAEDVTAFENACAMLDQIIEAFHAANKKVDKLAERLHKLQTSPLSSPAERSTVEKSLMQAYQEAKAAQEKLRGTLEPLDKLDGGHKSIVELIPIYKDKTGKEKRSFRKYTARYVRSDRIKSKWDRYVPTGWEQLKGTAKEQKSGDKAFLSRANGQTKIDTKELKKGLTELEKKFKTDLIKIDSHAVQGILFPWAESWNKSLQYDRANSNPDAALKNNIDLTAQAQLMRYFAGVGLAAEWDPKKGECALKAGARAEFAVAEAKASAKFYFPDKVGWIWQLTDKQSDKSTAIRFAAELGLSGMAGASIVAELGVAINYKDEKRKELGLYGAAVSGAGARQRELKINQTPIDPAVSGELEAFAGVKAELKLLGSVQWLNPEDLAGGYQDFAKVGPAITGMLGAGAGCMLELTYAAGKFRFRAMASVCLGAGAKGKLELEVDVGQIAQFFKWFAYQLYHADYTQLKFVAKEAFELIVRLHVMLVEGSIREIREIVGWAESTIRDNFDDLLEMLEKEERRVKLMERILASPAGTLRNTVPEAKGAMLYQLTRHDWRIDGLDARNHRGRYYGRRKDAVKKILREAQTRRDFDNIVQHMTPDGNKGNLSNNRAHLERFLDMAIIGGAGDDEEIDNFYYRLQASLKLEPTRGYPMCSNDSSVYFAQCSSGADHPLLADIGMLPMPNTASV
ncbi:hypothetical protein [Cupriavidus alkaliphilus]|uniref:hypothetical protein n=1 Tax=Cupriavidus alkaliphilus TaxID=942866 RepID=UPI00339D63A6